MTVHLTMTGYYAGTPLCGVNKADATARGDRFVHAIYHRPHAQQGCAPVCPRCLDIWENPEDCEDIED